MLKALGILFFEVIQVNVQASNNSHITAGLQWCEEDEGKRLDHYQARTPGGHCNIGPIDEPHKKMNKCLGTKRTPKKTQQQFTSDKRLNTTITYFST